MQAPHRDRERDRDRDRDLTESYGRDRDAGLRLVSDNRLISNGNNNLGIGMGAYERSNTHER